MTVVNRLAGTALGIHFADQIGLVLVPLAAKLVFDASAEVIGILVACQSLAHLFGSLPFGMMVDRFQLRTLVLAAALISLTGYLGVAASLWWVTLYGFGVAVTFAGFGVVLFTLSALSIVPLTVESGGLARANATLELPRTLVSFCVPLAVGLVVTSPWASWISLTGAGAALWAFLVAVRLPHFDVTVSPREGVLRRLKEGGQFVLNNHLLRAIAWCAVFWNLAFTALLVVMVPLLTDVYKVDPGSFGIALAAFGLAAIGGTWSARQFGGQISPNILLIFGPAISVVAVLILYVIPPSGSVWAIYAAFFLLGFGPAMWLITQNSVRQLVTPAPMLGRVNAVIQTTIYGMRPLGALMGGAVVSLTSPRMGLGVVITLFALSFLVAVFSQFRTITTYSDLERRSGEPLNQ